MTKLTLSVDQVVIEKAKQIEDRPGQRDQCVSYVQPVFAVDG